MTSFGEKLQREREMRGVTLEEIAEATKIGTRNLRALETNEFDKLPGGIFNKGFVRAYARYLGIDEEQAVADYLAASGQADAPATGPLPELPPTVKLSVKRRRSPWLAVVGVLLLLVAGLLVWRAYFQARNARAEQVRAPAETTSPAASTPVTSPASDSAAGTSAGASAGPQGSQPAAMPGDSATGAPAASSATSAASPAASATSAPAGFTLEVRARRDCWVALTVDSKDKGNHLMKASSQESIQATREIVMTVGNAGGLDLYLNGKQLPPQGTEGQKRTLTFTAQSAR